MYCTVYIISPTTEVYSEYQQARGVFRIISPTTEEVYYVFPRSAPCAGGHSAASGTCVHRIYVLSVMTYNEDTCKFEHFGQANSPD